MPLSELSERVALDGHTERKTSYRNWFMACSAVSGSLEDNASGTVDDATGTEGETVLVAAEPIGDASLRNNISSAASGKWPAP